MILLYEQLVQDLRRAVAALDAGDVEVRTSELSHALEVVGQLQGRLNMETGGEVAQNLDRFYGVLEAGILEAQFKVSKSLLGQLINNVLSVREAWLKVEQETICGHSAAEPSPVSKLQPAPSSTPSDWKV